jgi:hypothetical protein
LDGFARRMIDPSRSEMRLIYYFSNNLENYDASHFAAVPAIPELLVESLIRLPDKSPRLKMSLDNTFGCGFLGIGKPGHPWIKYFGYHLTKEEIICRQWEKSLQGRNVPRAAIRRAEVAFMRSSGAARVLAARRVPLENLDRYLPNLDKAKQGLADEKPSGELPPPVPPPTPVPPPAVVKREVGALEVTRIVDVRGNMADKAAVLSHPFVDPLDRKLLWYVPIRAGLEHTT